jgi:hypothetical protein
MFNMPTVKQTDRGSLLVRRHHSVRPKMFVVPDEDEIADSLSDGRSTFRSDDASTDDGSTTGAAAVLWDLNKQQERMRGFDDVANKLLHPEGRSQFIVRRTVL